MHTWSVQIVKQLLHCFSSYEYEDDGRIPHEDEVYNTMSQETTRDPSIEPSTRSTKDKAGEQVPERWTTETPILVAAKNGVMEIIENVVELVPVAIHDLNKDKKCQNL
ncbi:hypothetical protein K1719_019111 [Acacia pycnantha]|nr:hypothetical protein K1719_019111 [Acacia pycnantha]